MALTTTAASASANSYADTTYATSYFDATLRKSEWDAVANISALAQEQALYDAMLGIEAQDYIGTRSTRTQALQWPRVRNGSTWEDTTELAALKWYDLRGRQWVSNVVPTTVKDAQCEQALALATNPHWLNDRYKSKTVSVGDTVLDVALPADLRKLCHAAMLKLDGLLLAGSSVRRLLRS